MGRAVFAERAIIFFKEALVKRVGARGGYWHKYTDAAVEKYNEHVHNATHMTPNSAAVLKNRIEVRNTLEAIANTENISRLGCGYCNASVEETKV